MSRGPARRVTIVGGGIGGLVAALGFARRGARVTILEQAEALREIGAGLQITPNGAAVLDRLGLSQRLDLISVRAQAVLPVDGLSGARLARFDLGGGPLPYRFLRRSDLIELLASACAEAGVELRVGARVTGITETGAVTLERGAAPPVADLVVAADGLHSRLRPVLNPGAAPFFTGQVAWRAVIALPDQPAEARIWMLPGRHVVTYPLPRGQLNIVAVREQRDWAPEGWTNESSPEALQAVFADAAPELREILEKIEETRLWGLFRHEVAARWHGSATALIGDAAHPTLPFLAQGANLAIEDGWVLAACCAETDDLPAGLARYQALRRPRVVRAVAEAQANARRYHFGGVMRIAAHGGLRLLGRVAPERFVRRLDWLYKHDATRSV